MKRLVAADIPSKAAVYLEQFQRDIDSIPEYQDRILAARVAWDKKRRDAPATFRSVKNVLLAMHDSDLHCCYCELSKANSIDHFRPKSLYPSQTFVWENMVYACGNCNAYRGNRFAIFSDLSATMPTEIGQGRGTRPLLEPLGQPALIDPRREDPSTLLNIDLIPSPRGRTPFLFRPARGINARQKIRAEYTIDALGLNVPDLIRGRGSAFVAYRDILAQHAHSKSTNDSDKEEANRVAAILGLPHRFVWQEMKRWHNNGWLARIPELASLEASFEAAPEALAW